MIETTQFNLFLMVALILVALMINHIFLSHSKTHLNPYRVALAALLIGITINTRYLDFIFPLLSTFGLWNELKTIPYFFLVIHSVSDIHSPIFFTEEDVIFFDGTCGLCNRSVELLIRIDKNKVLRYSSLQGKYAQEILESHHIMLNPSIVFRSKGLTYEKAEAVRRILIKLGGFYKVMGFLLNLLPLFLLNKIYDLVARNRYHFFGKKDLCSVPKEEHKMLFLP